MKVNKKCNITIAASNKKNLRAEEIRSHGNVRAECNSAKNSLKDSRHLNFECVQYRKKL